MPEKFLTYEQAPKGKVFFVPGVGNYAGEAFEEFGDSLRDRGYDSHILEHPKQNKNQKWKEQKVKLQEELDEEIEMAIRLYGDRVDPIKLEKVLSTIPLSIFKEAKHVISEIEKVTSEQVHIVAHSLGAMTIAVAAILRPDLFKNIVIVSPLGFTEKNKKETDPSGALEASMKVKRGRFEKAKESFRSHKRVANLVFRYMLYGLTEKDIPKTPGFKGIYHYVRDRRFFTQFSSEIYDMADSDIVPFLDVLSNDFGIEITVFADDSDNIFSSDVIKKRVPEGVNFKETKDGGHLGIQKKGKQYAELVDEIFTSSEKPEESEESLRRAA